MQTVETESMSEPKTELEPEKETVPPPRDLYFNPCPVFKLTNSNFYEFVHNESLVLVMFYNSDEESSNKSKLHFYLGSKLEWEDKIEYAAVDCKDEIELFRLEAKSQTPAYKLYTYGILVGNLPGPPCIYKKSLMKLLKKTSYKPHKKRCFCF